jgi:hypothetical protein
MQLSVAKWRITHCISQNPLLWRPYSALPYSVSIIETDRFFSPFITKEWEGLKNVSTFLKGQSHKINIVIEIKRVRARIQCLHYT